MWAGIGVGAIVVIVVLALPSIVRAILRSEIQSAVAGNLNATIEIGDLAWHPLLGVTINNVRVLTPGPNGTQIPVAELAGLDTSLASIPIGGPIVVDHCTLDNPSVELVRMPDGQFQILDKGFVLAKSSSASTVSASATAPSGKKISDLIQVRHFEIKDFTVKVFDYTNLSTPQLTGHGDVKADLSGSSPGTYDFTVALVSDPLTKINLAGSIDADRYVLNFKNLSINAQLPPEAAVAQLLPELQPLCKQYGLYGEGVTISLDGGASAAADMAKNHWSLSGFKGSIALTSTGSTKLAGGKLLFDVKAGGPMPGKGQPLGLAYLASLDPDTQASITTDPADPISLQTAMLPQPVTGAALDIEFANRNVTVKNFSAKVGDQAVAMKTVLALKAKKLKLQSFRLDVASGALLINSAEFDLDAPHNYNADLSYSGIDLKQLRQVLKINDPGGHISGIAAGNLKVAGSLPAGTSPLATLDGTGEFSATNADFFDVPVLAQLAGKVNSDFGKVGRVGDAAADFSMKGGTATFKQFAVSSPLLGIQGQGTVGLVADNPLNLSVSVAPLGDWKKQIDKTGLGGVFGIGQIAGNVQNTLNQGTKELDGFLVTGPAAKPSIVPAIAKSIGGGANDVFGQMMKGGGGLLDAIKSSGK